MLPSIHCGMMLVFPPVARERIAMFARFGATHLSVHRLAAATRLKPSSISLLRPVQPVALVRPSFPLRSISHGFNPPSQQSPSNQWNNFVDRMKPFLALSRLHAPIGSALLFLPCASSIALSASAISASPHVVLSQTCLFGLGAFVMRGAGCTINDLWDRSIDKKVDRTRLRPLASGAITVPAAIGWLGAQLAVGLAVLVQLNLYSILFGASSLLLVVVYPLMKRITYWPQLVLGLAFNWGALLGSSAVLGKVDWAVALPLYLGHVCWTIVYDTIYAQQDKRSDVQAGVKSTALLFGPRPLPILAGFSSLFVGLTAASGYLNGCGLAFYGLSVVAPAIHLTSLLKNLEPDSPTACARSFKASAVTGSFVWLGCLTDYLVRCLL